jgi:hypothetical protein
MMSINEKIAASATGNKAARSLDHFVNCAGDIDIAGEMYRRLGFRVMPAMEHVEIGTSNTIVQLNDTYIELIGDWDHCRSDQIIETMRHWRSVDEYIYWQTAFTSKRLEDDQQAMRDRGMPAAEILNAYRRVRKIGGGWDQTASRSMYCMNAAAITGSVFISDHARPETIWMPGYTCHPNSVVRVLGMSYVARRPGDHVDYYSSMLGGEPAEMSADRVAFHTPRGEFFEILSQDEAKAALPHAQDLQDGLAIRGAAYTFQVESLERCALALRDGGVPYRAEGDTLCTPAAFGAGMAMTFVEKTV